MAEWNAEQYLQFKAQRTQPAIDLANRIRVCNPKTAADIGCGPGNSTSILKEMFPNANIIGFDTSKNMIEKAKASYPDISFQLCDARNIEGKFDLLFSNACLQWIPEHETLIPQLMDTLAPKGVLAVQIPMNSEEPLFKIMDTAVKDPKWGFENQNLERQGVLTPNDYFNILSGCSSSFQIWETVYYHAMPSHQALVEWVKGTRLRPYLAALSKENAALLEEEIVQQAKEAYPIMQNGEVILKFRRFFFTAVK